MKVDILQFIQVCFMLAIAIHFVLPQFEKYLKNKNKINKITNDNNRQNNHRSSKPNAIDDCIDTTDNGFESKPIK